MVEEGHEAGGQGEGSLVVKYRRASQLDPALHGTTVSDAAFVDEDAPAMPSATDAVLEELSVFEPYIKGMLQVRVTHAATLCALGDRPPWCSAYPPLCLGSICDPALTAIPHQCRLRLVPHFTELPGLAP